MAGVGAGVTGVTAGGCGGWVMVVAEVEEESGPR